jgi:hypothetical protein
MKRLLLSLPLLLCAFSATAFADDRIGYSTHFDKGQSPDVLMPLIVQSGVRLIRDDCGWGGIEYHAKGTYILGTRDKTFLDVAKASGVKVVLCLQAGLWNGIQYSPTWLGYSQYDPQGYAKCCAYLATAHPAIYAIEVMNEINNQSITASQYATLFNATVAAVHAANPNMKVIGMDTQGQYVVDLIRQCPGADGVSYHPYGQNDYVPENTYEWQWRNYSGWIAELRKVTKLPLFETERNCDSGASANQSAVWNARRLMLSLQLNVEHSFIYMFEGNDTAQSVVDMNAKPEPTYSVVQRLTPIIKGLKGTTFTANLVSYQTGFDLTHFQSCTLDVSGGETVVGVWFGNRAVYKDGTAPPAQICTLNFHQQHTHVAGQSYILDLVTGTKTHIYESNEVHPTGAPYWTSSGVANIPVSERVLLIVTP